MQRKIKKLQRRSVNYHTNLGYEYTEIPTRKNFKEETCNDDCKKLIAGLHSITQQEFQNMLGEYWQNEVPEAKPMSKEEVYEIVMGSDKEIYFKYSEFQNDNTDIQLRRDVEDKIVEGRYSKAFFEGIFLLFPEDAVNQFHFYKAMDDNDMTIAIVALKDNVVKYLGELSSLYP